MLIAIVGVSLNSSFSISFSYFSYPSQTFSHIISFLFLFFSVFSFPQRSINYPQIFSTARSLPSGMPETKRQEAFALMVQPMVLLSREIFFIYLKVFEHTAILMLSSLSLYICGILSGCLTVTILEKYILIIYVRTRFFGDVHRTMRAYRLTQSVYQFLYQTYELIFMLAQTASGEMAVQKKRFDDLYHKMLQTFLVCGPWYPSLACMHARFFFFYFFASLAFLCNILFRLFYPF